MGLGNPSEGKAVSFRGCGWPPFPGEKAKPLRSACFRAMDEARQYRQEAERFREYPCRIYEPTAREAALLLARSYDVDPRRREPLNLPRTRHLLREPALAASGDTGISVHIDQVHLAFTSGLLGHPQ